VECSALTQAGLTAGVERAVALVLQRVKEGVLSAAEAQKASQEGSVGVGREGSVARASVDRSFSAGHEYEADRGSVGRGSVGRGSVGRGGSVARCDDSVPRSPLRDDAPHDGGRRARFADEAKDADPSGLGEESSKGDFEAHSTSNGQGGSPKQGDPDLRGRDFKEVPINEGTNAPNPPQPCCVVS